MMYYRSVADFTKAHIFMLLRLVYFIVRTVREVADFTEKKRLVVGLPLCLPPTTANPLKPQMFLQHDVLPTLFFLEDMRRFTNAFASELSGFAARSASYALLCIRSCEVARIALGASVFF